MRRRKTITTSEICFQTCRGKYKQVFPACIASPLSPSCFKQQGSLLSCSFYPSRLLFSRLGARVHSAWVLPPLAQWGRWCSLARKRTHTHFPLLATGPICGSLKIVNRTALERSAQITSSISSPHRSVRLLMEVCIVIFDLWRGTRSWRAGRELHGMCFLFIPPKKKVFYNSVFV